MNNTAVQTKRLDNYVPDNINQKEINNNEQISKLRLPLIKNKSNDPIKNGQFYLCNSLPLDTYIKIFVTWFQFISINNIQTIIIGSNTRSI